MTRKQFIKSQLGREPNEDEKDLVIIKKPRESINTNFYIKLGFCVEPALLHHYHASSAGQDFVDFIFKKEIKDLKELSYNAANALNLLDYYGYMIPKYQEYLEKGWIKIEE